MTNPPEVRSRADASPELFDLLATFGDQAEAPHFALVEPRDITSPEREMLVHDGHMTVTAEKYCGGPVSLSVHQSRIDEPWYSRKITLHAPRDGSAILAGIMRFDLRQCSAAIRAEIVSGRTPLGRVLIAHDVMRTLKSGPYYRVDASSGRVLGLEIPTPPALYGRIATMDCDGARAVELLEIITL